MSGLFRLPSFLAWAALAAVLAEALWAWSERRRRALASALAGPAVLPRLFPQEALRARRRRHLLDSGGLVLLLLALAGPQWGTELVSTTARGTQVVIAVDTSASMLADDLRPSRIERARADLTLLLDGLKGQQIGIVAFAGNAQIQCPLTTDIEAARYFLRKLSVGMIRLPGTALGKAVALAGRMLGHFPGHKALVLLTDGEETLGSEPLEAVRSAAEAGIHLYILGMGTLEGAPIPVRDASGAVSGYRKDPSGQVVVSRLGEKALVELAQAGSGVYFRAGDGEQALAEILRHISNLDQSSIEKGSVNRYRNRYRLPLALAFLLILVGSLLPEVPAEAPRASRRRQGLPAAAPPDSEAALPRGIARSAAALLLAFLGAGCRPDSDFRLWRGNSAYSQDRFDEALSQYSKAARSRPADPRPEFNAGAAQFKLGDFEGAGKAFAGLAEDGSPRLKVPSWYNLGNSLFRQEKSKEAAEAYKRCLLLDPSDEDCRYNLALLLKQPPTSEDEEKGGGQDQKPQEKPSPPRPQGGQPPPRSGMSPEDAERLLRAVREKEKAAAMQQAERLKEAAQQQSGQGGMDW